MSNFLMMLAASGVFYLGFSDTLTQMSEYDCRVGNVQAACEVLR
tara:strand:- start:392 stop:523 length:132 start_codon:yes stop_codon:yes gene_type:complete